MHFASSCLLELSIIHNYTLFLIPHLIGLTISHKHIVVVQVIVIQACPVQHTHCRSRGARESDIASPIDMLPAQQRQSILKFDKVEISIAMKDRLKYLTLRNNVCFKNTLPYSLFTTELWKFRLKNCLILHSDALLIGLQEVICRDVLHENRKIKAPPKIRKSRIYWFSLIFIWFHISIIFFIGFFPSSSTLPSCLRSCHETRGVFLQWVGLPPLCESPAKGELRKDGQNIKLYKTYFINLIVSVGQHV